MAIIACAECGHHVSTQAASCPNCGAPTAPAAERETSADQKFLRRTLTGLAALAVAGAALWFIQERHGSLAETAALWRTERVASHPNPVSTTAPPLPAKQQPAADIAAGPPAVYVTTAEQLYRDYSANAVATRNRIGSGLVRVTGSVTEIDEDLAGHPVVKLASGGTESTSMLLRDDQKGAAAQLIKGESVGIQCDNIQRDPGQHLGTPQGSGCVLVLIDAGANPVYLAVSSANGKEKAPLYIIGPMPESACASRADLISDELSGNFAQEDIIAKRCSPTARDSVPASGCRLSASMPSLPDMPDVHLWRYDCSTPAAAPQKVAARRVARRPESKRAASETPAESRAPAESTTTLAPLPPVPDLPAAALEVSTVSAPVIRSFQSTPVVAVDSMSPASNFADDFGDSATAPAAASFDTVSVASDAGSAVAIGSAAAVGAAAAGAAPAAASAEAVRSVPAAASAEAVRSAPAAGSAAAASPAAGSGSVVISPVPLDNVASGTTDDAANPPKASPPTPPPSAPSALPPDLAAVKASDPAAADHIASYCHSATAAAQDPTSVAASCRQEEEAAWKRLVVNNEFPTLDEATRRKCNEAPFPDSYVAKESCAKYQLQAK
jgi:tRNA_anti-like